MVDNPADQKEKTTQVTVYLGKDGDDQYVKLKAILTLRHQTISGWFKEQMEKELSLAPWKAAATPAPPPQKDTPPWGNDKPKGDD